MSLDLLIPTALLAGFFGSSHCIGMCGAVVVLLEHQNETANHRWVRRILYNTGRFGFYALLGVIAGAGGAVLTKVAGINTGLMLVRLIAAGLVIAIGLNLLFDASATRILEQAGAGIWRRLSPLVRHVLPMSSPPRALAAGFLWGALPCGLVYSAVAMAAASGNAGNGILVMLSFWLGTAPALLLAGASANRLNRWKSSQTLRRIAGGTVVLIGVLGLMPVSMMMR